MTLYYIGQKPEGCPPWAKPVEMLFDRPQHAPQEKQEQRTYSPWESAFMQRMEDAIAGLGLIVESTPLHPVSPPQKRPRWLFFEYQSDEEPQTRT